MTNSRFSYFIGVSNCSALLGYGDDRNPIMKAFKQQDSNEPQDQVMEDSGAPDISIRTQLANASFLVNGTHDIVFRRFGDPNILPNLHVTLVFLFHVSFYAEAKSHLDAGFPWKLLSLMLNTLLIGVQEYSRIENERFPQSERDPHRMLPEDYAMRGLLWVDKYFPNDWFSNDKTDDDEKFMELASNYEERRTRTLWLGVRIARDGGCLQYDREKHQFNVSPKFNMEIDAEAAQDDMSMSETESGLPSTTARDFEELPDTMQSVPSPTTVDT